METNTDVIKLNIGGAKFEISHVTFSKFETQIQSRSVLRADKQTGCSEYFIERHAQSFGAILDFYQTGELHLPTDVCPSIFKRELEAWEVDWTQMSTCCLRRFVGFHENEATLLDFDRKFHESGLPQTAYPSSWEKIRMRGWALLDNPKSSNWAMIFLAVATIFVLLSTFVLIASTDTAFTRSLTKEEWEEFLSEDEYTRCVEPLENSTTGDDAPSFVRKRSADELPSHGDHVIGTNGAEDEKIVNVVLELVKSGNAESRASETTTSDTRQVSEGGTVRWGATHTSGYLHTNTSGYLHTNTSGYLHTNTSGYIHEDNGYQHKKNRFYPHYNTSGYHYNNNTGHPHTNTALYPHTNSSDYPHANKNVYHHTNSSKSFYTKSPNSFINNNSPQSTESESSEPTSTTAQIGEDQTIDSTDLSHSTENMGVKDIYQDAATNESRSNNVHKMIHQLNEELTHQNLHQHRQKRDIIITNDNTNTTTSINATTFYSLLQRVSNYFQNMLTHQSTSTSDWCAGVRPTTADAPVDWLQYIDSVCMCYFTLELIARFIFAPSRLRFLGSVSTWIDLFTVTTMYLVLILGRIDPRSKYTPSYIEILNSLQLFRVLRLIRLVKNVTGFRVLVYSVRSSWRELCLLFLYLLIAVTIFATSSYFFERDNMKSIPDAGWWAIITMTTVGYGDVVPKTGPGKIIGSMCAMSGVLLIAVTVPVFVNNFLLFYESTKLMDVASHKNKVNDKIAEDNDDKKSKSIKSNRISAC
ncbi:potassium voltage-gated channel subfamily A member 1-like [Physella acuta]|uniref:potassium voltage-gated channel subfamily A member 1-like n=1 Tax=Physella acuta TaxID=109671 RepID=UPI0027DBEC45|nr:potassium voltage-gated channel subfamily A member 1-like [Physella acuta]